MKNHHVGQSSMRKFWISSFIRIKKFLSVFSIKKIDDNEILKAVVRKMGFLTHHPQSDECVAVSEFFAYVVVMTVCFFCIATSACCVFGRI